MPKFKKKSQFYFPPENLARMEMLVMIKKKCGFSFWALKLVIEQILFPESLNMKKGRLAAF